nr:DUF397 domain-containing protein [Streptomyces ipomoeae]
MIPELSTALWHKSPYSNGGGTNCVEVANGYPGTVPDQDQQSSGRRRVALRGLGLEDVRRGRQRACLWAGECPAVRGLRSLRSYTRPHRGAGPHERAAHRPQPPPPHRPRP